ncbi:MAG: type IV pilus assembly protein PilM [Deltaproteobacteria bacterium]|nr:type IV pilus assembly protein PilM [Deltaproteobacteria bacterium]
MAKGKLAVGLDIGSSSIKVCALKQTKRGYSLQAFGMVQLPPEAIVDGALMNASAVVDGIQELFAAQKIKHKEVATSVSGHSVIIKKINLPQMTPEELEESIQWEAEQYIPFDISDVNIDVQILNTESTQAGQMDVLLVAAKKDMVNDYTSVIMDAGLSPVVVDVDAFAVQNMFEINYEVPRSETVVLINIGASVTNINVLANGISTFTRDIAIGGSQFTDAIQKALNVSYDEAEALKLGGGGGKDSDAVVPQEVERVLQSESEAIANEIQRSLDFYAATSADAHIARIFLSGGSPKIPALVKTIERRTSVPVEVVDPFRNIDVPSKGFDTDYLKNVAPMAAVAVGLALRSPNDK